MHTQVELERRMLLAGRNRLEASVAEAEGKGKSHRNPYAQAIHRNYTAPLAEALRALMKNPQPVKGGNAIGLLAKLDPVAVAFLAVRSCLNTILAGEAPNHRSLAYSIGRSVHYELVLSQIAEALPDLHFTLARDFQRRMSEDEEHRMAVYKTKAKEAGASWAEWGKGSRDVVGVFLLGRLEAVGLVELSAPMTGRTFRATYREVTLRPEARAILDSTFDYLAETRPDYGPCVEPPLEWHGMVGGGYHTAEMRRAHRYLVKVSASARPMLRAHDMPEVTRAVNHLQATPWRVNQRVLETVLTLAKTPAGVPGAFIPPSQEKPSRPELTGPGDTPLGPQEEEALAAWKAASRAHYEAQRLGTVEYGRFYRATRQAQQLRDYPSLYFVHFLDSRGRDYVLSSGVSPQGSDLQKALLEFAEPMEPGIEGMPWFFMHGANCWGNGMDKAALGDRILWGQDQRAMARRVYLDPVGTAKEWGQAEEPLQFLAWCLEAGHPDFDIDFPSRVRVGLDGSCNGLQHFSAMLRDEVGGAKVNLLPGPPQDVYTQVAQATAELVSKVLPEGPIRSWWESNGVERAAMKRATMALPYNITKDKAVRYVAADYLTPRMPDYTVGQRLLYARGLMDAGWAALAEALPAAMSVRAWLTRLGMAASAHQKVLSWRTPSGFLATQAYFKAEVIRVKTWLHGSTSIRVAAETDKQDQRQHSIALAPNFVHSIDAAHLHRVANACADEGIAALGFVHDSFSTHAANTARLGRIIREQFVQLYAKHDVLAELLAELQGEEPPPERGNLDITQVLSAPYAFS